MVKYLRMDGLTSFLVIPQTLTIDKIIVDASYDKTQQAFGNGGLPFIASSNNGGWTRIQGTDGSLYSDANTLSYSKIPFDQKIILEIGYTTAKSFTKVNIFNRYDSVSGSQYTTAGNLYSVKLYNAGVLIGHYDMSTGTVQDQSGNGNHAILTGGTWLETTFDYLQMDGVKDYIQVPSLTFTDIYIDAIFEQVAGKDSYYFDPRIGSSGYAYRMSNGTDSWEGYNIYVDGVSKSPNTSAIPSNQRIMFKGNSAPIMDDVTIFSRYSVSSFMKGKIYSIKFYNGATLVAHYDMSKGTVQDQSGNGNHAILTGGTWVSSNPNPPILTIVSIDKNTISHQTGQTQSKVTFTFDQDVTQWTVNVLGADQTTGTVADYGGAVTKGTQIQAVIDDIELVQEGGNRINIYGQNSTNQWTPYNQA